MKGRQRSKPLSPLPSQSIRVHLARLPVTYQVEMRTWQALVVYKSKVIAKELGGQGRELDTAEGHLMRQGSCLALTLVYR